MEIAVQVVAARSPTQSPRRRAPRNAPADVMADLCAIPGCGQLQLAQAVEINDIVEIIRTGQLEDALKAAKEKTESDISDIKSKIHRFPAKLRGFGRDRDYIIPRVVAIGPYYHGEPELQAMEVVKRMAAYYFCDGLADTPEEVYKKIFPIACDVRGCYADADALKGVTDDNFAAMMFLDGCFLVQCIVSLYGKNRSALMKDVLKSKGLLHILRDIMLLENQIPWPVIQLLTALRPTPMGAFIGGLTSYFRVRSWHRRGKPVSVDPDIKPPHLLGLIHFYLVRSRLDKKGSGSSEIPSYKKDSKALKLTTSAAELAKIGVKLTSSGTTQFSEMEFETDLLFGRLSLAALHLDDSSACWLVNMVAFEQCTGTKLKVDYPINSYLSIVALLMNRDDDVRELHGKGVVHTTFDYNQTLQFFKCLAHQLVMAGPSFVILKDLQEYEEKRPVCIAIHKFLYNNRKTIAAVLSIVGVLVGIFKTLLSLKQHQP